MLAADIRPVPVPVTLLPPSPAMEWKAIAEAVEPFLQRVAKQLIAQTDEFEPQIAAHARYALTARGKQLRPMLVALSAQSIGPLDDAHLKIAVIIEMVHLATLVHDDVIDESGLRRGRPTLSAKWGNEISVLLGDCLFAHSLKLATDFPTPEICRAVASATKTVCAGEILQKWTRGDFDVTRSHYFKVLTMKTAALFSLSCDLGGSHGTPAQREALRQYGLALGTAYQLYDDCLDVLGSEAAAGKTVGADLAKGKMTLPVLIVRDRAKANDQNQLRQWLQNWDPACLPRVVGLIHKYDAFIESRAVVQQYLTTAREALMTLPESEGRAGLLGLTHFLAEQTEALGVGV